jgi:DNA-binding GntR family transcriptional regulator
MRDELSQRVYEHLCSRLLSGSLAGGDKISELAVARETGTSRSPVREAMVRLAAEGLLDRVPKLGAFVRTPSPRDIRELFEVRRWLEAGAAASLASGPEPDTLRRLVAIHEDILDVARRFYAQGGVWLSPDLTERLGTLDSEFHLAVAQATGNDLGLRMLIRTHMMIRIGRYTLGAYSREHVARLYTDHDLVLRAIRRADPEQAWSRMDAHVQWTGQAVSESFKAREASTQTSTRSGRDQDWPEEMRRLLAPDVRPPRAVTARE